MNDPHDAAPDEAGDGAPPDSDAPPGSDAPPPEPPPWLDEEGAATGGDEPEPFVIPESRRGADLAPLAPRWRALEAALDALAGARFAVSGTAPCAPPVIRVDGRELAFPLTSADRAALRAACSRSAFGDGARTTFDPDVRSAWELDPDRLEIEGLPPILDMALAETARVLGEGPLVADLYKLLYYERGDRFRAHRDGVKQPGMIATLVIGLPGEHEGGELRASVRGDEARLRLASTRERTSFIAFYADCVHELSPIERGSRACLSFAVRRRERPTPMPLASAPTDLVEALDAWLADPAQPGVIVVPLVHAYPGGTPPVADLRGDDRALVPALLAAARITGCAASLCSFELEQDGAMGAEAWTMRIAEDASAPEEVPTESLVWPFVVAFLHRNGGSWWTGNEGDEYAYRYRHAALVLRRPGEGVAANEAPSHEGREAGRLEERALTGLLERARDKRFRRLDLTWLCDFARLGHDAFQGLGALGDHLEELSTPPFAWLSDAHRLGRLHTLVVHGQLYDDLSPALVRRLRVLELHGGRDLSDWTIRILDEATCLQRLLLSDGQIRRLPEGLSRAPLRSLCARIRALEELPGWLGQDGLLEELDVRDAIAVRLVPPAALGPSLRVLDLGGTSVSRLDLSRATSLQRLDLDHCPIDELPEGLARCVRLESLSLASYANRPFRCTDLSPLAELPSLRALTLTSIGLRELPRLPEPSRIEILRVPHNELRALPASVGRMSRLRELSASSNGLREVPDLSGLDRLRVLELSFNALSELRGLERLGRLEVLALLSPGSLDLSGVEVGSTRLSSVALRGVRLSSLPRWLLRLADLEELTLDDAGLAALPIEPGMWPALSELTLHGSALVEVPRAELLPSLRCLDLGDPPAMTPDSVARVKALRARGVSVTWSAEPEKDAGGLEGEGTEDATLGDDDIPF